MPCTEFINAINWKKSGGASELHPVVAYFTKHYGYSDSPTPPAHRDAVHYASGEVAAVDSPKPHLKGTLKAAKNSEADGVMSSDPTLTYDVEIYPDGKISYLMKLNGKSVGGMPATEVQATCVNNVLLSATNGSEVIAVGVARKAAVPIPK